MIYLILEYTYLRIAICVQSKHNNNYNVSAFLYHVGFTYKVAFVLHKRR